jgi:branched-chain amino acid transport system permease protein
MAVVTGPAAFLLSLLTTAVIFSVLALGLNLQWGYTGLFNFSVAAFWAIGAYTAAIVTRAPGAETAFGLNLPYLWVDAFGVPVPFPAAVIVAAAVSAVVAVIISIPTLRLRADYLAIATLGLAETIRLIILNERWLTEGGQGMAVQNPITGTALANVTLFALAVLALVLVYAVLVRAIDSPWGRVLKGIREDEDATNALGKNTFRFKMQSFVIGSVIITIGGTLTALQINYLVPQQFNPEWTFFVWIAVLLGGTGSNRGAILGGFVLAFLLEVPRYLNDLIPYGNVASNSRLLIIGVLIIVIMTFRPQGLLGDEGVAGE